MKGSDEKSLWKITSKSFHVLSSLHTSSWNVTPTFFQRSTFPSTYHKQISVIHDGIDTNLASPATEPLTFIAPDSTVLTSSSKVITFVNRRIEPYRGAHTFIRSIPKIQELVPDAKIVIVGGHSQPAYGAHCPSGCWRDQFLSEIAGHYDPHNVHFTGNLEYEAYLRLLKISSCHVYLTYPFVLSWSLLEAMSIGAPIVASKTEPVEELIDDGVHGLLVDFFSPSDLAEAVQTILTDRVLASHLAQAARKRIIQSYSLEQCLPRHLALLQLVATGSI